MTLFAHVALIGAWLIAGEPSEFAVRLRAPAVEPRPITPRASAESIPYANTDGDAIQPPDEPPGPTDVGQPPRARKLGTNTTIFVNFDGVEIEYCNPPNSHANCSWLDAGKTVPPFSGSLSQRVAILDAMRSLVSGFGIRVTGQRPPADEIYVMVVYGGDSVEEEALGRAPAGDCWDDLPNEIAHVYLDGDRAGWIDGGASTALHEAAHTWGFDHIGLEGALMAPSGGNTLAEFFDGCAVMVEDLELTPGEASCPDINLELCGLANYQNDVALLRVLFGDPYVDDKAPTLTLVQPFDGIYYEGPASFAVEIEIVDDLHPQIYEMALTIAGLVEEPEFSPVLDPSFDVELLPVGTWSFEVRVRDMAGNEATLAFEVVVGDHPPILDDGNDCACRSVGGSRSSGSWSWLAALIGLGLRFWNRRRESRARAASWTSTCRDAGTN